MKTRYLIIFILIISLKLNACPAFSLEDSSYNDMKKSGLKVYNNVLFHINIVFENLNKNTYKKKNMTDLSRAYLVFDVTISNWLNFMPKGNTRTFWEKTLVKFKKRLAKIYRDINSSNILEAKKELNNFKTDFILFYMWNPMDTVRTALENKDKTILNQCNIELNGMKNTPKLIKAFIDKVKKLNITDERKVKEHLEWQKKHSTELKKEFGEYFEKNPQL